jgi:hypothetical protein
MDLMLNAYWEPVGVDWINWFMYDSDYGERNWSEVETIFKQGEDGRLDEVENEFDDGYGAHDADGTPICYDVKSLYDYIKQYEKPIYEVLKNPIPKPKKKK